MRLSYAVALADCRTKKMPCYRGDFDTICSQLATIGYEGVELFARNPRELDQQGISATVKRYELAVPEVSAGMAMEDGLSFTDPDAAIRAATNQRMQDYIDMASRWGAQVHLGRVRGAVPEGTAADDAWKWMKEGFIKAADYGQSRGVRVLVEPQCRFQGNAVLSVLEGIAFVEEMNHPNLGIVADTFHMNIEDPSIPASLMAAKAHLTHVHFADSNRWYPGAGHINFQEVLQALRLIGYTRFITMEVEQKPDSVTAARRAIQTVRALLEGLQ